MRAVFTGLSPLMFPDYTDLDTGRVLTAVPGGVYDIAPASGRNVPGLPGSWFTAPADGTGNAPEPLADDMPEADNGED